jgi:hypothetical protein
MHKGLHYHSHYKNSEDAVTQGTLQPLSLLGLQYYMQEMLETRCRYNYITGAVA